MGYWGPGIYENDQVWNLLDDFWRWRLVTFVVPPLAAVTYDITNVDFWFRDAALGAADLVAAVCGYPSDDLPETAEEWVKECVGIIDLNLVLLALKAVKLCKETDSWVDASEEFLEQREAVFSDLIRRLQESEACLRGYNQKKPNRKKEKSHEAYDKSNAVPRTIERDEPCL